MQFLKQRFYSQNYPKRSLYIFTSRRPVTPINSLTPWGVNVSLHSVLQDATSNPITIAISVYRHVLIYGRVNQDTILPSPVAHGDGF